MKYAWIVGQRDHYSVSRLCRVLGVSRTGYCQWRSRAPSARARANADLDAHVRQIHIGSRASYGRPRIVQALRRQGLSVGGERVRQSLRRQGLRPVYKRPYRVTTDSSHHLPVAPNLLDRRFDGWLPNRAWVADLTYIATAEGWLYLAVIMDLASRRIVGWSMSERMKAGLVCQALRSAYGQCRPPFGLILHSDQGSQGGFNRSSQHLIKVVFMGRPAGWMYKLTGRGAMRSPGAPSHRRETERRFWEQIATGITSEKAAEAVGVSQAVGTRWFRHNGGMALSMLSPISGRYLSFAEREEIGLLSCQEVGVREIARRIGRSPSTVSRELTRNAATRSGRLEYRASVAQWKAELVAKRPKPAKLTTNPQLHHYVQERLAGKVRDAKGRSVSGPVQAPFIGRNKPHRSDRKWVNGWSPEQISNRLQTDFPDDESMRISHEAIYQALYIQGRGALKRELVSCLRTGRALRVPRARAQAKAWAHVSEDVMISNRPAEAQDRAVPGHWEGDLIIGLNRSAIGTLVERSSRFTMLVHLPREEGYGLIPRTKNGPALAGYGAVTMANALKKTVTEMPAQLWQSLTWDRGKELSDHARFTVESGVQVFFADPHSPWQRGTNENTNGLLRQYFPKGTDLSRWSARELQAVANALNSRPRKTLGWKTPAEALDGYLKSVQQSRVATTG